jgi:hypothetical protein
MKNIIGCSILALGVLFSSCGNPPETKMVTPENDATKPMKEEVNTEKTFPINLVNNKKDPTCGMPVTAGIHDTAHYGKWVLGFCSKECKEEAIAGLAKNSKTVLAGAEINIPVTPK